MPSFPYVSDVINAIFETQWHLPIPTFGAFVAVAVLAASLTALRILKGYEQLGRLPLGSHATIPEMAVVATLAGIVGARIFDILDHLDAFFADPLSMIFTRSGFSIYGGLFFGVAAGVLFVKRRSVPVLPMLDAMAPAMMLGYGIGRLGCQLSGDGDWGVAAKMASKPSLLPDWLWSQTYDGNIAGVVIAAPGVYPTPLYETGIALTLFGLLWVLRAHGNRAGYLFSLYLLAAGFERLLIEKIRVNVRFEALGVEVT